MQYALQIDKFRQVNYNNIDKYVVLCIFLQNSHYRSYRKVSFCGAVNNQIYGGSLDKPG